MNRGEYAPLARDRHAVVGWGADQATSYAAARALRPIAPALDASSRLRRGARDAWRGASLLGGRGAAEVPLHQVGGEWFHSVADRRLAIAQLTSEFQVLANDLAGWINPRKDTAAAQWVAADVTPLFEEWRTFADRENASWWTSAATSWEAFEGWHERLRHLRELARAHGIALSSAEPAPLPRTIWQQGAAGQGTAAASWAGVLKVAIAAAIGITGFVGLYAVLRDIGGGR